RTWPSSITRRSSRSRIFCSRAETSVLLPVAGTFAVCWAAAAQVSTTIKANNIWEGLIRTPLTQHAKRSASFGCTKMHIQRVLVRGRRRLAPQQLRERQYQD